MTSKSRSVVCIINSTIASEYLTYATDTLPLDGPGYALLANLTWLTITDQSVAEAVHVDLIRNAVALKNKKRKK